MGGFNHCPQGLLAEGWDPQAKFAAVVVDDLTDKIGALSDEVIDKSLASAGDEMVRMGRPYSVPWPSGAVGWVREPRKLAMSRSLPAACSFST